MRGRARAGVAVVVVSGVKAGGCSYGRECVEGGARLLTAWEEWVCTCVLVFVRLRVMCACVRACTQVGVRARTDVAVFF